ncbi:hypothetical protein [Chryseobacterium shigense]|uniref:Uncharacterized protein n=1 Tax=Chryseobacterium shigense TaxID=297244 RepID=A0A841NAZ9_9FLAO|nr:hypothetical protein [Chryseobacterium shigense]MBB6369172.1 hypothetical protein [Chryseobacterium shigense]
MKTLSYISLLLFCTFSCKDNKISNPTKNLVENSTNKVITSKLQNTNIDQKWYGIYKARFDYGKIGGVNAGWDLEIHIDSNHITVSGSGYQIGFKDEVTATEEENKLILKYKKNIDGYSLGKNMNPEFILIKDNDNFYIQSEWIDSDIITKPEAKGFIISKKSL